ncbi:RidA family protein [Arthrobacter cavernae]|uniref:RidA family protein n=1 Tax=Arthrobacter cavernae TaxID=2817681 RepID=A0A939HEC2_9MICC|nr:RidA family protein [Arthrobacter cavernae]MBO1269319.1 RidA family protein [Arthrobacter cavernae]
MTTSTTAARKAFVPVRRSGNLLFVSGQLPLAGGELVATGIVGATVTVDQAREAAEACANNCLAVVEAELGSLENVDFVVKLNGYVASASDFTAQAAVMDAASDVVLARLGDAGEHARLAIGVASLPLGAAVEVEMIVAVKAG